MVILTPKLAYAPALPKVNPELRPIPSRGEGQHIERRLMTVTAYTAGRESTGKYPWQKDYCITASGNKAREWYTIATGPEFDFGTVIYIPYFADKPNHGVFVVEDRGVSNGCIDVYFGDPAVNKTAVRRSLEFGRRDLKIWIRQ